MPELPDLIYIQKTLHSILPGKKIAEICITEPIVIRVLVPKKFEEALLGAKFKAVYRRGPFLGFTFDNQLEIVLHPMLAGRLKLTATPEKPGRAPCLFLKMTDGTYLFYLDDKKMGKVYLIHEGDYQPIPKYLQQGVDILSPEFTLDYFRELIKSHRTQVRVFLMNQTALSAIGNAYADEILFDARLHPKTFCQQLTPEEVARLYHSIIVVIRWGIAEVEKAGQPIEVKVRDHVKVRNRKDQPCPRCGTTIRRVGVLGHDAFFCPNCQPAARQQFIDWK
jgi:formamidopyrimidine-DNA glycosylase